MSRFKPGDLITIKRASYCQDVNIRAVIIANGEPEPCPLCNDPECAEWRDLLGVNGRWYYHWKRVLREGRRCERLPIIQQMFR